MNDTEMVTIDFDGVIKETALAWLIRIDDDEVWLPKSQCDIDKYEKVIDVPEWLALNNGLI